MSNPGHMKCALKVDTASPGWHKTMTRLLKSIHGLSYSIDAQQGLAYVSGQVNPNTLLTMLAKVDKYAQLCWVDSGDHNNKTIVSPPPSEYGYPPVTGSNLHVNYLSGTGPGYHQYPGNYNATNGIGSSSNIYYGNQAARPLGQYGNSYYGDERYLYGGRGQYWDGQRLYDNYQPMIHYYPQ